MTDFYVNIMCIFCKSESPKLPIFDTSKQRVREVYPKNYFSHIPNKIKSLYAQMTL